MTEQMLKTRKPRTSGAVMSALEDMDQREAKRNVTFSMSDHVHSQLKVYCAQTGKKMGAVIEDLLKDFLINK
jgi:hypothetical protein